MIVVTGATGHIGNALVRALAARRGSGSAGGDHDRASQPVRALVRPGRDTSCLAGLGIECVEGDTRDFDSLVSAFQGADVVFHLAGKVTITKEKLDTLRQANVAGTSNVIASCRAAGVRRLVYTSSIHAFVDTPRGTCIDESTPIDPARAFGVYGITKAEATRLVFAAGGDDLQVVVVFPTGIVGPYDFRPSETGQVIIDFCRRKIPAWTDGAYNFVDVRDVADGLIAALERGRAGEGYILSGNEVTVRDLLHMLEELTGKPAPRLHVSLAWMKTMAPLIPAYYWATRQRPLFTKFSLEVLGSNCEVSNAKARRELGYSIRPLRDTLADSLRWFEEQGVV